MKINNFDIKQYMLGLVIAHKMSSIGKFLDAQDLGTYFNCQLLKMKLVANPVHSTALMTVLEVYPFSNYKSLTWNLANVTDYFSNWGE